jgi:enamine deaminase RidA (YjgF/YER057c/UK114 family)
MKRRGVPGADVLTLSRDSIQEHFVTLTPEGDESPESLFRRAGDVVGQLGGDIVSVESLGVSASDRQSLEVLTAVLDGGDVPVGWVENSRSDNLCGVHLWLVGGTEVIALHVDGRRIGSFFEDDYARYCRLVGLLPFNGPGSRSEQAGSVLRQMDAALLERGMHFDSVLRTWFYNSDILDWYGDFNATRDAFFAEKKVFEGLLPASTGVGGRNAAGAALTAGTIAVQAKADGVRAFAVPSPLQSAARDYGSSFSRAVELDLPDHRRLYVSGTASIDRNGKTVFIADTSAQVKLTMEVVEAILRSRDMDWVDVTRALAYFKSAEDAGLFETYRREHGLPSFPAIVVENDICRDDLLFELEVDAIKTG